MSLGLTSYPGSLIVHRRADQKLFCWKYILQSYDNCFLNFEPKVHILCYFYRDINAMELFLLPKENRCRLVSLLLSAVKVDRDIGEVRLTYRNKHMLPLELLLCS